MQNKRTNAGLRPGPRATRARILAGAAEIMVRNGLHSIAVRDILEAAEVSRGTFYQYFARIDDVLLALYDVQMDTMLSVVGKAIAVGTNPEDQLSRGLDAYLDLLQDKPICSLVMADAIRPDSILSERREKAMQGLILLLDQTNHELFGVHYDPYVFRTLLVGIEGLMIYANRAGPISTEERARIKTVVNAILMRVMGSRDHMPKV